MVEKSLENLYREIARRYAAGDTLEKIKRDLHTSERRINPALQHYFTAEQREVLRRRNAMRASARIQENLRQGRVKRDARIIKLWQTTNMGLRAIARLESISATTVCSILRSHGIYRNQDDLTKEDVDPKALSRAVRDEMIIEMWLNSDMSSKEIATAVHTTQPTVSKVITQHGYTAMDRPANRRSD